MVSKILKVSLCIIGCGMVLWVYFTSQETVGTLLKDYYIYNFISDTGAKNAVAAIYLNYRIFDTMFEALMLLISVIGVIYFSWRNRNEK